MDENRTLEEKCENLMNIVVDSRKKFGKMCGEFGEKIVYYETEMLKLQNIASCRSKIKGNYIPKNNTDGMEKDLEEFKNEMLLSQKRMDELQQNVKDMQSIVLQLKNDAIGRKLRKKITADALLAEAKKEENMHK